jgi:protease I
MRIAAAFLTAIFLICNISSADQSAPRKAVMIIASSSYQDTEYLIPRKILEEGKVEVKVASSSLDEAEGTLGGKVQPDLMVSEISPDDFDAIIFVGGPGASEYYTDEEALALVREAKSRKKILAAICIAPVTLARAGILRGVKATCWYGSARSLRRGGARYTGRQVEVSGRIITANGPQAAEAFGSAILQALSK